MPILRRGRISPLYSGGNGELRAVVRRRAGVLSAGRRVYGVVCAGALRIAFGVLCALVAIGAKKFVYRRTCSLYDGAEEFAFAPYLVAGVAFALFAGDAVLNLYLSLFL